MGLEFELDGISRHPAHRNTGTQAHRHTGTQAQRLQIHRHKHRHTGIQAYRHIYTQAHTQYTQKSPSHNLIAIEKSQTMLLVDV